MRNLFVVGHPTFLPWRKGLKAWATYPSELSEDLLEHVAELMVQWPSIFMGVSMPIAQKLVSGVEQAAKSLDLDFSYDKQPIGGSLVPLPRSNDIGVILNNEFIAAVYFIPEDMEEPNRLFKAEEIIKANFPFFSSLKEL